MNAAVPRDPEPEAARAAVAVATAAAAVPLAFAAPSALVGLALGLAGAAITAVAWAVLPRLPTSRQTAGESAAALAQALVLAVLVHAAGPGSAVVLFAAVTLGSLAAVCTIWQTSSLAAVLVAVAVAGAAWSGGATAGVAAQAGLGLLALGLGLTASFTAVRRQRTSLQRQLHRVQGDLADRKSVEQRLRETHESLEKQTIALTDTNRRIEKEIEVRRAAEARALEAARLKDSFLRTVSHELRTPLNAVIGYTEGLLEDDPARPLSAAHADLGRILESSQQLLALIDGILDLSKIESGTTSVELAPVDVRGLADEVVRASAAAAARNGDTIRLRCEDDLAPLVTDRTRLRQVLLHLLDNACKFTRGGTIRLVVRTEQARGRAWFVFEVSDTGIGVAPEMLAQIFNPFVQADGSTTRRYGGAGIGLAMCRHYCSLLGGDIGATSTPGAGSTFTVRLPAAPFDPRREGVVVESRF